MFSFLTVVAQAGPHAKSSAPKDIQYSCPTGYMLNGKTCTAEIIDDVQYVCASGYQMFGNMCETSVEQVSRCPAGSQARGKGCERTEFAAAQRDCPSGFVMDGMSCTRQFDLPLVAKCLTGQLVGNSCMINEQASYIVEQYCPAGYTEGSKGCERVESYDCTAKKQTHHGKGMQTYTALSSGHSHHGHHGRHLGEKKHNSNNFRGSKGMTQPKVEVISQMCQRTEYAHMESSRRCPTDFAEAGKGCERVSSVPAQMICSNGGSAANCSSSESRPAHEFCPAGYQMNGSQCSNTVAEAKDFYCATGNLEGGRCIMRMPAQERCAAGFTLRNGVCMGEESVDVIATYTVTCVGKGCNN